MVLRCFIVDDSRPFLAAARSLLEREGIAVVGVASSAEEALRTVQDVELDVVLVDVELGADSGFDLVRRFQRETSVDRAKVIMISTYADEDLVDLVAGVPAAAFLAKSRLSARAIRQVLDDAASSPG